MPSTSIGAHVYFVTWPGRGVAKVGYAGRLQPRISRYTSKRGGVLVESWEFAHFADAFACEDAMSSALREHYDKSFSCREEGEPLLGLRGSGWTECLNIPDQEIAFALSILEEVVGDA